MNLSNKSTINHVFASLFRLLHSMWRFFSFINVRSPWFWLGVGLGAVLIRGLFLDVMDVDAAQYASIAREMLQNKSWLQVQHRGADYLDKPPLLFWLSAASFAIFGPSNWVYKLPSMMAALLGIWSVYRFCLLYYTPKTARQAAFIFASALGLVIICNDVRTDTLLLGTTTCAVWLLAAYLQRQRWRFLLGGFLCIGLAMLAKGPIGMVVPSFAVGTHLIFQGRGRDIFKWQWILGLLVTALVLAPMCLGLWLQFDTQPGKLVNGRTGVSGLYFFFWEQSFGRVTGENVWRNNTSAVYFLHVYVWAFLPWSLLLPFALKDAVTQQFLAFQRWLRSLKNIDTVPNTKPVSAFPGTPTAAYSGAESYAFGAFVLTFVAMSMSQYKLPHYIFITLPWAAVLLASHLHRMDTRPLSKYWHWGVLYCTAFICLPLLLLLPGVVFPTVNPVFWSVLVAAIVGLVVRIVRNPFPADSDKLVQRGVWTALIVGLVLNFHFYPHLLPYQSAKSVAEYAREHRIPPFKIAYFHRGSHALDFYNGDITEDFESFEVVRQHAKETGAFWLHADEAGKGELSLHNVHFEVAGVFPHFQVALLKIGFLDPSRRASSLDTIYLLKILSEQN